MTKGLKSLKKIKETNSYMIQIQGKSVCVPYYDDIEKELKAFELIKPYIDVYAPNRSVDRDEYMLCVGHDSYEIQKEIYDLFKEVLL